MRTIALAIVLVVGLILPAFAQKAESEAVNAKRIDFFNKGDFAGVGCRREWCWNSVTRSPAFREYPVRRRGQSADRWALWRASANHQPCACGSDQRRAAPRTTSL